jgi:hypothetical protein
VLVVEEVQANLLNNLVEMVVLVVQEHTHNQEVLARQIKDLMEVQVLVVLLILQVAAVELVWLEQMVQALLLVMVVMELPLQ